MRSAKLGICLAICLALGCGVPADDLGAHAESIFFKKTNDKRFNVSLTSQQDASCYSPRPTIFSSGSLYVNVCKGTKVGSAQVHLNGLLVHTFNTSGSKPISGLRKGQNLITLRAQVAGKMVEQTQGAIYRPSSASMGSTVRRASQVSLRQRVIDDGDRSDDDDLMTAFLKTVNSFDLQQFIEDTVHSSGCGEDGCAYYHDDKDGKIQHEVSLRIRKAKFNIADNTAIEVENNRLKLTVRGTMQTEVKVHLWGRYYSVRHQEDFRIKAASDISGVIYATKQSDGSFKLSGSAKLGSLQLSVHDLGEYDWSTWIVNKCIDWFDVEDQAQKEINKHIGPELDKMLQETFQPVANTFFQNLRYDANMKLASHYPGSTSPVTLTFGVNNHRLSLTPGVISAATDVRVNASRVVSEFSSSAFAKSFYLRTSQAVDTTPDSRAMNAMVRHALFNRAVHDMWRAGLFYWPVDGKLQVNGLAVDNASISLLNPPILHDPTQQNKNALFASNVLVSGTILGQQIEILLTVHADHVRLRSFTDSHIGVTRDDIANLSVVCSVIRSPAILNGIHPACNDLMDYGEPSLREALTTLLYSRMVVPLPTNSLQEIWDAIDVDYKKYMKSSFNKSLVFSNIVIDTKPYYPVATSYEDTGIYARGEVRLAVPKSQNNYPQLTVTRIQQKEASGGNTKVENYRVVAEISGALPYNIQGCEKVALVRCTYDDQCSQVDSMNFYLPDDSTYVMQGHEAEVQTTKPTYLKATLIGCQSNSPRSENIRHLYIDSARDGLQLNWQTLPDYLFVDAEDFNEEHMGVLNSLSFKTRLLNGLYKAHAGSGTDVSRKIKAVFSMDTYNICFDRDRLDFAPVSRTYKNNQRQESFDSANGPQVSKTRTFNLNQLNLPLYEGSGQYLKIEFYDLPTNLKIGEYRSPSLTNWDTSCFRPTPELTDMLAPIQGKLRFNERIAAVAAMLDNNLDLIGNVLQFDWFTQPEDYFSNFNLVDDVLNVTGDTLLGAIRTGLVTDMIELTDFVASADFSKRIETQLATADRFSSNQLSIGANTKRVSQRLQQALVGALTSKGTNAVTKIVNNVQQIPSY
jgi:hypothetical protein